MLGLLLFRVAGIRVRRLPVPLELDAPNDPRVDRDEAIGRLEAHTRRLYQRVLIDEDRWLVRIRLVSRDSIEHELTLGFRRRRWFGATTVISRFGRRVVRIWRRGEIQPEREMHGIKLRKLFDTPYAVVRPRPRLADEGVEQRTIGVALSRGSTFLELVEDRHERTCGVSLRQRAALARLGCELQSIGSRYQQIDVAVPHRASGIQHADPLALILVDRDGSRALARLEIRFREHVSGQIRFSPLLGDVGELVGEQARQGSAGPFGTCAEIDMVTLGERKCVVIARSTLGGTPHVKTHAICTGSDDRICERLRARR
ncbi:MAG: hypothetical protein ABI704_11055 [Kofleriaceae bacterium]